MVPCQVDRMSLCLTLVVPTLLLSLGLGSLLLL
jgi:hypothetical protein